MSLAALPISDQLEVTHFLRSVRFGRPNDHYSRHWRLPRVIQARGDDMRLRQHSDPRSSGSSGNGYESTTAGHRRGRGQAGADADADDASRIADAGAVPLTRRRQRAEAEAARALVRTRPAQLASFTPQPPLHEQIDFYPPQREEKLSAQHIDEEAAWRRQTMRQRHRARMDEWWDPSHDRHAQAHWRKSARPTWMKPEEWKPPPLPSYFAKPEPKPEVPFAPNVFGVADATRDGQLAVAHEREEAIRRKTGPLRRVRRKPKILQEFFNDGVGRWTSEEGAASALTYYRSGTRLYGGRMRSTDQPSRTTLSGYRFDTYSSRP